MILFLLIGVLWAGTAGAEPSDKNTVWGGLLGNGQLIELDKPCNIGDAALTNRDRLIHCHGYGWTETQMMPTACEQKMQAAMEAMDRFMPMVVMVDALQQVQYAKDSGRVNEEWLLDFIAASSSAQRLWTEAKACWRK